MVLSIQLPTGRRLLCPVKAARLTSSDGSLSVEHPPTGDALYASGTTVELVVREGFDVRCFRLHLMNARLTPEDWTFLVADFTELPEPPAEAETVPCTEQVLFPMI